MANEMVPNWQFNVLPGNANQGAILVTRKDIQDPPFDQDAFIWLAMEDIIGTADIKLEYNDKTNIYTLYKSKGHRDNNGNWSYEWGRVGSWERLSPEVAKILRQLTYSPTGFEGKLIRRSNRWNPTCLNNSHIVTSSILSPPCLIRHKNL